MSAHAKAATASKGSMEDARLVEECLKGSPEAWSALVDKYKNLIFSIPVKQGFSQADASDIFQAVWLAALETLPQLRQPRALAAWLIQMTSHKCSRWRAAEKREAAAELPETVADRTLEIPGDFLGELEREQMLRESVAALPPDCHRLIELLFIKDPPVPYEEAAQTLGMAKGSIGATRMRCLEKLHRALEKKGFR